MAIRFSVLGSGSRGNSTFVATDHVRLLIDCGLGPRTLKKRLAQIGEDPSAIDAVLVTHEHNDHVGGLAATMKSTSLTAFMSCGTIEASRADTFAMNGSTIEPLVPGRRFPVGDVEVDSFRVPHDAAEPVGFSILHNGVKVTQLTDLGWIPGSVSQAISGSDVLIIESNHDLDMLRMGGYPWSLKERLMSRNGHLSNRSVARFLQETYDGRASRLVLAHLSSKNNHPEIARLEASRALELRGLDPTSVMVAWQDKPTAPLELG